MKKIKTILLVVTLTFGLILAATNFAVSAVAQTVTTGSSGNYSTATDNATTLLQHMEIMQQVEIIQNPVSKVPLIGQFFK